MGTFAEVTVPAHDGERLAEYVSAASATFMELTDALSVFDPGSEISALNRAAGRAPVPVSPRTLDVLGRALEYAALTKGCFDPTVAPLVQLWGVHGNQSLPSPPAPEAIGAALARTGYRHLVLSGQNAHLDMAGRSVDLGGIAKGYAVDVCFDQLSRMGAASFMVDLGGNIRCRGGPDTGAWRIGVRHPFCHDRILGVIRLTGGRAVATSGNYERFVTIGGQRYAHIIDPRTGIPVTGMAGVTVVASSAVEADALSTALFVMGWRQAARFLARRPEVYALSVPDEKPLSIRLSPGMDEWFTPEPDYADAVSLLPAPDAR